MVEYLAGKRIRGLSSERILNTYQPVTFDNSTIVNGMSATNNVISGASVTGSWQSYIRSNKYISPSKGGGEFKLTGYAYTANNKNLACGLEKSPYREFPNDIYKCSNYGWHFTSSNAGNDIYEKASLYDITPSSNSTSQVWKITMDSSGNVKYYVDDTLVRTSTVTASGNYYIIAGFASTASDTATITAITNDNALTNIQDGSIYEETDTNKMYIYNSSTNSWTQV